MRPVAGAAPGRRSPRGERGLKLFSTIPPFDYKGRSPRGERGLKYVKQKEVNTRGGHSPRGSVD